jgi:hypothetical protein
MKLVDDQRAALGILAASVRGRPESLMLAHVFAIGMLRGRSEMDSLPLCGRPHITIGAQSWSR